MIRNSLIFFIGVLILVFLFSGCIYVLVGSVSALGGYAISRDTIQGEIDRTYSRLWDSSIKVLEIMGSIKTEDKSKGVIEAKVDDSEVKIKIEELTPKTIRFRVTARKYLFPDMRLAQKIYIKVVEHSKK